MDKAGTSRRRNDQGGAGLLEGYLPPGLPLSVPFQDFTQASQAVLAYLRQALPFQVWMVTRTDGQEWVVLQADDAGTGVKTGDTLPYADSFCANVVSGVAPNLVPDCQQVACFRDTMARLRRSIGAYVSFPLYRDDGSLFGTLCALDSRPHPNDLAPHAALLDLLARQLATILHFDLAREAAWRQTAQAQADAMTDALTGLLNRRGWEWMCEQEEQHSRDYGSVLSVLVIDLDGLKRVNDQLGHAQGDAMIANAGQALRRGLRQQDTLSRTGGDEFQVLLPGLGQSEGALVVDRLRSELGAQGIEASIGLAQRKPYRGLQEALNRADVAMYEDKQQRKTLRGASPAPLPPTQPG